MAEAHRRPVDVVISDNRDEPVSRLSEETPVHLAPQFADAVAHSRACRIVNHRGSSLGRRYRQRQSAKRRAGVHLARGSEQQPRAIRCRVDEPVEYVRRKRSVHPHHARWRRQHVVDTDDAGHVIDAIGSIGQQPNVCRIAQVRLDEADASGSSEGIEGARIRASRQVVDKDDFVVLAALRQQRTRNRRSDEPGTACDHRAH